MGCEMPHTQVLPEQPGEYRVSVGDEAFRLLLLLVLQTEKRWDQLLNLSVLRLPCKCVNHLKSITVLFNLCIYSSNKWFHSNLLQQSTISVIQWIHLLYFYSLSNATWPAANWCSISPCLVTSPTDIYKGKQIIPL